MRLYAAALAMSTMFLAACGGDNTNATDGADVAPVAGAAEMPGAMTAGTMMPVTGTVHEIRMVGDAQGYRFEPAERTIAAGDGVKFIMVSGAPHNVDFQANGIPAGTAAQLSANIPEKGGELGTPIYTELGKEVTISFAGLPAGEYNFNCTPHLPMGMVGKIIVQ